MKLALTRRGEYDEPIRAELEQLVAAIATSHGVEHDAEGRQRVIWQRWDLGENLSLATGTETTVPMRLPDRLSTGDLTLDPSGGVVTVRTKGVYRVTAQLRFAANGTGVRTVAIYRDQMRRARCQVVTAGAGSDTEITVAESFPCVPGSTIYITGTQTSGGALNVVARSTLYAESFLTIERVA